jgi:hypothetical protein
MPNSRRITSADCDPTTHCIQNIQENTTEYVIATGTHAAFCQAVPNNTHIIVEAGATLDINGTSYDGYLEQDAGQFNSPG